MKHQYTFFSMKSLKAMGILLTSMSVAFSLGIQTAGDVKPVIDATRAAGENHVLPGDFDGDSILTIDDAKLALGIAEGSIEPTEEQMLADVNGDGRITVSDALMVLDALR